VTVAAEACPDTATDLTCEQALLIIEPYFAANRELFSGAGLERVERTELYCAPWIHDAPRHFAACREDGLVIVVAPQLAELDERMVLAILAHELGHAGDFLYPGEFVLGPSRKARRRRRVDFEPDQWARWMRSWESRDDDTVEFVADAVAEHATGMPIGYVGPCQIQCFARGQARPQGLR
jgi:hypothetical protein